MAGRRRLKAKAVESSSPDDNEEQRQHYLTEKNKDADSESDRDGENTLPVKKKGVSHSSPIKRKSKGGKHDVPSRADSQEKNSKRRCNTKDQEEEINDSRRRSNNKRLADSPAAHREGNNSKRAKKVMEQGDKDQEEEINDSRRKSNNKRLTDSPAAHREGNNSKRAKKVMEQGDNSLKKNRAKKVMEQGDNSLKKNEDTVKKLLCQRLWSDEDIITMLKGLIQYAEKNGIVPASVDIDSFHGVIKKAIHLEASKNQVAQKISKLKMKFRRNLMKETKNGKDRKFSKDHDKEVYQLSKLIWGAKPNENLGMVGASSIGLNNIDNEMNYYVSHLKPGPRKEEVLKGWKQLRMREIELNIKKIGLLREIAALEAEELNSN